jgi:hypothetical protein
MSDADSSGDDADSRVQPITIPDGIYIDLPEEDYHNATALGSSDIRKLAVNPEDFWFESKMNPLWEPDEQDEKEALVVGAATHVMVLYGRSEFERRYGPCDFPGNRKLGIEERKRVREAGKIPLKRQHWDRIELAGGIFRGNRYLKEAFSGGVATEISVFWTVDGLQKKCRIDYLKQRATVDLKTIANKHEGMSFKGACRLSIAAYNYPVQAEHYREGREQMFRLAKADDIYVGRGRVRTSEIPDDEFQGQIGKILLAARSKDFAFVIVFVQKTRAPLTWATKLSRGNGVLDVARKMIERAEENYRRYMESCGPDVPWLLEEPVGELAGEELPTWWGR